MSDRTIALTIDIGLRLLPQPPIPIVMPDRSSATTSSSVHRLSVIVSRGLRPRTPSPCGSLAVARPACPRSARSSVRIGRALVDERVAVLVGHTREVQFEREPLLEAVAALDVPQV